MYSKKGVVCKLHAGWFLNGTPGSLFGKPQMWERAHAGFGGTGRKRKGPCTKQYAWRKHGLWDTRLAEACPPKLRNTVKYRVEEMRPKWPFWKQRAPKMRLVEAQCAHRKHCYPEIPLGGHPTSRVSQFIDRGLLIKFEGLLCGNPTERGESSILNFWLPGSL